MGFPNNKPAANVGVQTLLQNIVLFLRTRPGSDSFNTERGTILGDPNNLSRALRDITQLKVLVTDAVAQTQTFIISEQQKQINSGIILTTDETLEQLEVNNVYQGDDPTAVLVEILVTTAGNKQFIVTV
jgi:hypothetical protein